MQYPPAVPPRHVAADELRSLNIKLPDELTWHPQGIAEEESTAATVELNPIRLAASSQANFVAMMAVPLIAEVQVSLVANVG